MGVCLFLLRVVNGAVPATGGRHAGVAQCAIRPDNAEPDAPVFRRLSRLVLFKKDLAAAGIPYRDAHGRYADFHALRHTTNTNLARAGVGERIRMAVMRHSDARLTATTYTDASQLPTTDALTRQPSILQQGVPPSAQLRAQRSVPEGLFESQRVATAVTVPSAETAINQGICREKSRAVAKGPGGEMVGATGFEPVTSTV